jgi:dihydropteroate synthase
MFDQSYHINAGGNLINFERVRLMAIVNVTPDSFYDGGTYNHQKGLRERINKVIDEGADIIDLGGMSTRPGSEMISAEAEWKRLEPALETIREISPTIPVSVDTFRAEVADKAVSRYNAGIVNDISGGQLDKAMFDFIADKQVPYVLMHMQGTPANMQKNPHYEDVVGEVMRYFHERVALLREKGVHDIIIDPGFGFGKSLEHNYELFRHLERFKIFGYPLLTGISRKSMITRLLNLSPAESLNGTTALHSVAIEKGSNILRVHDVNAARQVVLIMEKIKASTNNNW